MKSSINNCSLFPFTSQIKFFNRSDIVDSSLILDNVPEVGNINFKVDVSVLYSNSPLESELIVIGVDESVFKSIISLQYSCFTKREGLWTFCQVKCMF